MTHAQTGTLVLKDAAGSYFPVSLETLEQGRVPAERKAEVEQAITAARDSAGRDDVEGYVINFVAAFCIGLTAGVLGAQLPQEPRNPWQSVKDAMRGA